MSYISHTKRSMRFPSIPVLLLALAALLMPTSIGIGSSLFGEGKLPAAACAGGPTIDDVTLDECYDETFTVGGVTKTVRVWYSKTVHTSSRTVDGSPVSLTHYINSDAEAIQVAQWGREAWEKYYDVFGHHPFNDGCSNRINVQMEDGVGWAGIAYWASSGSCRIGIDSPMVRGGGGQFVVYHEFQHYLQYSYNSGCYGFLRPNYSDDAEFVEGYADLAADGVNAAIDASAYGGITYDPSTSMYAKSYGNIFNKYFIEQLGVQYNPTDPWHHLDALKKHYESCDTNDTLYVLTSLIPSLKAGMTEEKLFTNFFGANWAKDWASASTQPELVYTDDNGNPYGNLAPLTRDDTVSTGTPRNYISQTTPDKWAAKYYQVTPMGGCSYVQASVDGAPGAHLGINLMSAKTSSPTAVRRYSNIGEDYARTFPTAGGYSKVVAAVNSFSTNFGYDVAFNCVTPTLNILEPRQANYALVGAPDSPIAFLVRVTVKDGTIPVLGISESAMTVFAGLDAATIVANSLQQVGEEYWMIVLPPVKPAGTTFVDLKVCLDGTLCDSETNALLYVNPGNTDQALVFDASGSMSTEDVVGEGTRLLNAQKAGTVMADQLRAGDRVLVTSFSATNSPVGCGLPGGTGNCPLDIITHLARLDVTVPSTNIPTVKTAINAITAREWTPIGAALRDAKNKLLAAPSNTNTKHIILLSDGQENVNPLYASDAALRAELYDSGVVIDTVGLSGEATPALLAQIAADTGGIYRYVPTTAAGDAPMDALPNHDAAWLTQAGVPPRLVEQVTTAYLPGPLALDNVYDYLNSKNKGSARLGYEAFTGIGLGILKSFNNNNGIYVDGSVSSLRIVVASKQGDANSSCGENRIVEVADPNIVANANRIWYPISPRNPAITPTDWDIRNSLYDDVAIIKNPAAGIWKVRAYYSYILCDANGQPLPGDPAASSYDFSMSFSSETSLVLQGRFLAPLVSNQGYAGDVVPIVATLLNQAGAVPGALVVGVVEKPGGASNLFLLFDDGNHNDGAAGDGNYGWNFSQTALGGSYNVRIVALYEAVTGFWTSREWLGGFYIDGPSKDDLDQDGMPDRWERSCKLDTAKNDAQGDLDNDGLTNYQEYQLGTSPCNPDTDGGGEKDGSEVRGQRNPLDPADDKVSRLGWYNFRAFKNGVSIRWTPPAGANFMTVHYRVGDNGQPVEVQVPNNGAFDLVGAAAPLPNDTPIYLSLAPNNTIDGADGPYSEEKASTPKADPDAPVGTIDINNGALLTLKRAVTLTISATDTYVDGMASPTSGSLADVYARTVNLSSGGVQMRIANEPTFEGATWQDLAATVPWQLSASGPGMKRVYIQFRDAALNESMIVYDDIQLISTAFVPFINR